MDDAKREIERLTKQLEQSRRAADDWRSKNTTLLGAIKRGDKHIDESLTRSTKPREIGGVSGGDFGDRDAEKSIAIQLKNAEEARDISAVIRLSNMSK